MFYANYKTANLIAMNAQIHLLVLNVHQAITYRMQIVQQVVQQHTMKMIIWILRLVLVIFLFIFRIIIFIFNILMNSYFLFFIIKKNIYFIKL